MDVSVHRIKKVTFRTQEFKAPNDDFCTMTITVYGEDGKEKGELKIFSRFPLVIEPDQE